MDRETFFINKLIDSKITYKIGDDAVVIDKYVYAMDLFCEGVHFTKEHFSYYKIAKKAMLVNISDILAMGAKPIYALLGISFSEDMRLNDIKEFQRGIKEVCKEYKIKIIGGDTIKDNKLNIAITIIGETTTKTLFRNNLKAKEILFYTGNLGSVLKDMRYLYRGGSIPKSSKFLTPKLNANFVYEIARFTKCAMDISDGLYCELNRLSKLNNVKFSFFRKINNKKALSGEEYELLLSISKKDIRRLMLTAKKHRVSITKLAITKRGRVRFHYYPHHN
ncbi:thiamine-phosphate kinase [Helicobacter sp. MIT 14-3879]|uniref:thiamine-phosphate kinase n=1 Tax=Helicobacter sp. MIT 14-3879 TaxID=2040649 RepID=UPI0015F1B356|nr:thiamine-phosphate kinase [Helicobacter sp. MIT 14-3879]